MRAARLAQRVPGMTDQALAPASASRRVWTAALSALEQTRRVCSTGMGRAWRLGEPTIRAGSRPTRITRITRALGTTSLSAGRFAVQARLASRITGSSRSADQRSNKPGRRGTRCSRRRPRPPPPVREARPGRRGLGGVDTARGGRPRRPDPVDQKLAHAPPVAAPATEIGSSDPGRAGGAPCAPRKAEPIATPSSSAARPRLRGKATPPLTPRRAHRAAA